jgi:hypothetical protein
MLVSTDFIGYWKIAQDNNTASLLTAYIARYEKKYLVELFGYDLYILFLASLVPGPAPVAGRFLTVYNPMKSSDTNAGDWPAFYPVNMGMGSSCLDEDRNVAPPEPMYSEKETTHWGGSF